MVGCEPMRFPEARGDFARCEEDGALRQSTGHDPAPSSRPAVSPAADVGAYGNVGAGWSCASQLTGTHVLCKGESQPTKQKGLLFSFP